MAQSPPPPPKNSPSLDSKVTFLARPSLITLFKIAAAHSLSLLYSVLLPRHSSPSLRFHLLSVSVASMSAPGGRDPCLSLSQAPRPAALFLAGAHALPLPQRPWGAGGPRDEIQLAVGLSWRGREEGIYRRGRKHTGIWVRRTAGSEARHRAGWPPRQWAGCHFRFVSESLPLPSAAGGPSASSRACPSPSCTLPGPSSPRGLGPSRQGPHCPPPSPLGFSGLTSATHTLSVTG